MKVKKRQSYQYGGIDDGDKAYKRVKAAPAGYTLDAGYVDKDHPNRKYYKKVTTSGASTISRPKPKPSPAPALIGSPMRTPVRTTARPRPVASNSIDRVYTEPDEVVTPPVQTPQVLPTKAFEGENIFMHQGVSNKAIGQAMYPSRSSATPSQGGMINTGVQPVKFQYYKPNTGQLSGDTIEIPSDEWNNRGGAANFADTSFINKYRKPMAMGGEAGAEGSGGAWSGLAGEAPDILNAIIGMISSNPNKYSRQPIVNRATIGNMATPYSGMAYGGTIDDLDDNELAELQQMADDQGVDVQDMFDTINQQQMQGGIGEEGEESPEFGTGGWIGKASASIKRRGTKGKCTPMSKPGCTGRALALAKTFKKIAKNNHAYGGRHIEVEGDEIVQEPGGQPMKISGPSHEEGGVAMNVAPGTKIFSDRLSLDGKSMQERKMKRENRLKKLEKLFDKRPSGDPAKNTLRRMTDHVMMEEDQDMKLQDVANKIYAPPQKRPYGGEEIGYPDWRLTPDNFMPDEIAPTSGSILAPSTTPGMTLGPTDDTPSVAPGKLKLLPPDQVNMPDDGYMGAGDYVGMAGSLFNSVAPIINTIRNKNRTAPVLNRYMGVGQRAIDANETAQDYVAGQKSNAITDVDTAANASIIRNRNSAQSVNTQRALDTISDIVVNKSKAQIGDTFSRQMIGLLGQKGQLTNNQDTYQAYGQTQADDKNAQNRDNYYSNMAENLVNAGEGAQSIGRNINIAKQNKVDTNMLSWMTENNIKMDNKGNVVDRYMTEGQKDIMKKAGWTLQNGKWVNLTGRRIVRPKLT